MLNKTVPYHKIQKVVRFRVSEIEQWIDGGGLEGAGKAGPEGERQGELCFTPAVGSTVGETAGEAEPAKDNGDSNTGGTA